MDNNEPHRNNDVIIGYDYVIMDIFSLRNMYQLMINVISNNLVVISNNTNATMRNNYECYNV